MLAAYKGHLPALILLCLLCFVSYRHISTLQAANTTRLESTILANSAQDYHNPHNATSYTSTSTSSVRDLILYSYHETPDSHTNLLFFLAHGLHSAADFIFMINGEHDLPRETIATLTSHQNIRVIERENRCFDLGGFYEILIANETLTSAAVYKRYIFINSSLRGPFFPSWAQERCWSDAYWNKLDADVKLVGMTFNCANGIPFPPHLQSMILAFSHSTLTGILLPNMKCYETMDSAVGEGETRLAGLIMERGAKVVAMEGRFAAHAGADGRDTEAFLDWCVNERESGEEKKFDGAPGRGGNDILHSGNYEGGSLHPFETIFAKTNRDWDDRDRATIDFLTEHANLQNYSSFDRCGA